MNWTVFILSIYLVGITLARPGIRTPPARLLRQRDEDSSQIQSTSSDKLKSTEFISKSNSSNDNPTTVKIPTEDVSVQPNYRLQTNSNQNQYKTSNTKGKIPTVTFQDLGMNKKLGITVSLSADKSVNESNLTSELNKISSTPKEGISTWILLSGTGPTKGPQSTSNNTFYRNDEKIIKYNDKVMQPTKPTIIKDKKITTTIISTTSSTTTTAPSIEMGKQNDNAKTNYKRNGSEDNEKPIIDASTMRRKKPDLERQTELVTKKFKKPSTILATESHLSSTVSSTTPETTTFLILEPKDADFDMPQDRSPGPTTKKPKRGNKNNKTKKNNNKNNKTDVDKKPGKVPSVKDKPLSTKIYNYLAREVMPTVGMGLVGLAVTAGLATYFLGPLTSLRRSYDIADRKDDIYFYNNEEYAGSDGQSEEEVFGKVIAGMPANSPYRNNIKYTIYRPNQPHKMHRPGPYDSKYHVHSPPSQYRYRNTYPPHHSQAQHPAYSKIKPNDPYSQQFFRYNNDINVYRTNSQSSSAINVQKPDFEDNNKQSNSVDLSTIITSQQSQDSVITSTEEPVEENNVLRRRSQFVVGSVQTDDFNAEDDDKNVGSINQPTVESVPEHGPRRRKRRYLSDNNEINDTENEVDGIVHAKVQSTSTTPATSTITTTTTTTKTIEDIKDNSKLSSTEQPIINTPAITSSESLPSPTSFPPQQNIFDLLRSIFEMKVRMSLNFLQNTTEAFQRYLKSVERRVDESKIFSSKH